MKLQDLQDLRRKWLAAAYIYYIRAGDETSMSDHEWDRAAKILHENKDKFPDCPILNDPNYKGGSLFWVKIPTWLSVL